MSKKFYGKFIILIFLYFHYFHSLKESAFIIKHQVLKEKKKTKKPHQSDAKPCTSSSSSSLAHTEQFPHCGGVLGQHADVLLMCSTAFDEHRHKAKPTHSHCHHELHVHRLYMSFVSWLFSFCLCIFFPRIQLHLLVSLGLFCIKTCTLKVTLKAP